MVQPLFLIGTKIQEAVEKEKMKRSIQSNNDIHKWYIRKFKRCGEKANANTDQLGVLKVEILKSFKTFSTVFEKIQNRPQFTPYIKNGINISECNTDVLNAVSSGASVWLDRLNGAAAGIAGKFAAMDATTAVVTALSSVAGCAALGSAALSPAPVGVAVLVGGAIFRLPNSLLSPRPDEVTDQQKRHETGELFFEILGYLVELRNAAATYTAALTTVYNIYKQHVEQLQSLVEASGKTNWEDLTAEEKLSTENTVLLVGLLYNMCKVKLVLQSESENTVYTINHEEIENAVSNAETFLQERNLVGDIST